MPPSISAIFLATSPTGVAGSWTDRGLHDHADSGASFLGINKLGWGSAGWPLAF